MSPKKKRQKRTKAGAERRHKEITLKARAPAKGQQEFRHVTLIKQPWNSLEADEKAGIRTVVEVLLPFSLEGLPPADYIVRDQDGNQQTVNVSHLPLSMAAVAASLGPGLDVKGFIDIENDSWGRANRSLARVTLPHYCTLWPGDNATIEEAESTYSRLLEIVCDPINRVIETYVFHTERYDLRPVCPSDFQYFRAQHQDDTNVINEVTIWALNTIRMNPQPAFLPVDVLSSISEFLANPEFLSLAARFLSQAHWYAGLGHSEMASILGVSAMELSLSDHVRRRAARRGMNIDQVDKILKDIGLTGNMKTLLPLILSDEEFDRIPNNTLEQCAGHIRTRNRIIHEGSEGPKRQELDRLLADVSGFVAFLRGLSEASASG